MSGGSFNYLFRASPTELLNKQTDLSNMVKTLAEMGFKDAAEETEDLRLVLNHFEVLIQARWNRLYQVWQAVEWKVSGDWGMEQVQEMIDKYRGKIGEKP